MGVCFVKQINKKNKAGKTYRMFLLFYCFNNSISNFFENMLKFCWLKSSSIIINQHVVIYDFFIHKFNENISCYFHRKRSFCHNYSPFYASGFMQYISTIFKNKGNK